MGIAARRLVFTGVRRCEVEAFDFDPSTVADGAVAVATEVSVVSTGTELAGYTAIDPAVLRPGASWQSYPWRPGYGAVCRVLAAGPSSGHSAGQRLLAIGPHASHAMVNTGRQPALVIGEDDRAEDVVLLRMASVAMTALRLSRRVRAGRRVAVIGLGLVGNFAAQIFRLAGCEVCAFDLAPSRVEAARRLGLDARSGDGAQAAEAVKGLWPDGCDIAIEAIGIPDLVAPALAMTRTRGEVILLGSPRGPLRGDGGALLSEVHLRGITVTGALEWMVPFRDADAAPGDVPSIQEGYRLLYRWLREGGLKVEGLLSHRVAPDSAQDLYLGIDRDRNAYMGVAFDWRGGGAV